MAENTATATRPRAIHFGHILESGAFLLDADIVRDHGVVLATWDRSGNESRREYITWTIDWDPRAEMWRCHGGHYFRRIEDAALDYNKRAIRPPADEGRCV